MFLFYLYIHIEINFKTFIFIIFHIIINKYKNILIKKDIYLNIFYFSFYNKLFYKSKSTNQLLMAYFKKDISYNKIDRRLYTQSCNQL